MSSLSYWERRKAQEMFDYMAQAEHVADEISKLYLKASRYLSLEMDQIFERFQRKHRLSEAEARRLLNMLHDKTSIDELKNALRANKSDQTKAELLAELESSAYQARIEKLQQTQNQMDHVMHNIYNQEKMKNTSFYLDLGNEAYYRSIFDVQQIAGFGFSFSVVDPKMIEQVINSKWSGENYSKRIWSNTQALAKDLKEELLINLVTGRTDREVADIIANKFAVGSSKARRLVRTEACNLANQMEMQSYEECGIDTYIFLATLDLRTSDTCRSLDGKRFPVSEQQPGKNCPPMHPWCRSTTICDITDEELARMKRRSRDPATGKSKTIPGNMTYQQWYDQNVKGNPEAELSEKMIKHRVSDRKQYEKYKKVLGKYVPDSLDSFQKMKYTDSEKWEYTKGLKSYLEKYPTSDKRFYDVQVDLKEAGISVGVPLPPVNKHAFILPEGKHDPYHIMHRMMERGVTDDELRSFMSEAKCMFVQWSGARQRFVGENGMVVVAKSDQDWIFKTAWKRDDYDSDADKIMEVIKKHGL